MNVASMPLERATIRVSSRKSSDAVGGSEDRLVVEGCLDLGRGELAVHPLQLELCVLGGLSDRLAASP